MKSMRLVFLAAGLAAAACQPAEHIEPADGPTGTPPPPATQIFAFDAADPLAPRFLDANLEATNALTAEFVVAGGALMPSPVAGAFPASAGADANLLAGVGFGTYANPDLQAPAWDQAGTFQSVLTATVTLSQAGDAVKLCRSFATTCVSAQMTADGQGLLLLDLAANVPDVEIGEVAPGVSAAVRGTGESGLTIALADPSLVAVPFTPAAGTPFTLTWSLARGAAEGSLDYAVAIDGTELASGNTAANLAGAITTDGGVALLFDTAVAASPGVEVDYDYAFDGDSGEFDEPLGFDVSLSPQVGLGFAPLYVYPTAEPDYTLLTLTDLEGFAHGVQAEDGILGAIRELPASAPQTRIYSVAFDGDDFAGTPLAGLVDQGIAGGGFYPSPTMCYSQIFPVILAQIEAGVRKEVHRRMYVAVANGVAEADAALPALAAALQAQFGLADVTYTAIGSTDGPIAIGTDYADSNVDANIDTEVDNTYTVTLEDAASQTFRDELGSILAALAANDNQIRDALIGAGALALDDYVALAKLHAGLTEAPGSKDGVLDADGNPVEDDPPDVCNGYDCVVEAVLADKINGTNESGLNPAPEDGELTPTLAHVCLWGVPPAPAQPAQDALLGDSPETDHPAYPEVPAQGAVPPARELAAAQMNTLVQGIYANFIGQAFGPAVPASSFSLSMKVGDPASGSAPALGSLVITTE